MCIEKLHDGERRHIDRALFIPITFFNEIENLVTRVK